MLTRFNKYVESFINNWDPRPRSPEWLGVQTVPGDEIIYKTKTIPISNIIGLYDVKNRRFKMAYNRINYHDKDYIAGNANHSSIFRSYDGSRDVRFRYCKPGKVLYIEDFDLNRIISYIPPKIGEAIMQIVKKVRGLNLPVDHVLDADLNIWDSHGCDLEPEDYKLQGKDLRKTYKIE